MSCTHTYESKNPWWSADLGVSRPIGLIKVYNREDCCQERLTNYVVTVGDN